MTECLDVKNKRIAMNERKLAFWLEQWINGCSKSQEKKKPLGENQRCSPLCYYICIFSECGVSNNKFDIEQIKFQSVCSTSRQVCSAGNQIYKFDVEEISGLPIQSGSGQLMGTQSEQLKTWSVGDCKRPSVLSQSIWATVMKCHRLGD